MKNPAAPIRGVVVEVPAGAPPGTGYAILHRGGDGQFRLSFRSPTGRLLGGVLGDPGRPVNLWPEHRSRPQGDPAEAIARAKRLAARRARPQVEEGEAWRPPAPLPAPLVPLTPEGIARTLRKLARRKRRRELIALADVQPEMPALPPNELPYTLEAGMAELNRRHELAVLRARYPDLPDEILNLL